MYEKKEENKNDKFRDGKFAVGVGDKGKVVMDSSFSFHGKMRRFEVNECGMTLV